MRATTTSCAAPRGRGYECEAIVRLTISAGVVQVRQSHKLGQFSACGEGEVP